MRCEAVLAPLLQGARLDHARMYRKEVHYALSNYTNTTRPRPAITPRLAPESAREIRSQGHTLPHGRNEAPDSSSRASIGTTPMASSRASNGTTSMVVTRSSPEQKRGVFDMEATGTEGRAEQGSWRRPLGKSGPAAPRLLSETTGVKKTEIVRVQSTGSIDWSMDDDEGKGKPIAQVGDVARTESIDWKVDDEEGKRRGEGSGSESGSGSMPRVLAVTSENVMAVPPGDQEGNARVGISFGEGEGDVDGGENQRRGRRLNFDGGIDGGEWSQLEGRSLKVSPSLKGPSRTSSQSLSSSGAVLEGSLKVSSSALDRGGTANGGTANIVVLPRSLENSWGCGLHLEIGESTSPPLVGGSQDGNTIGVSPEPSQSMTPFGDVVADVVKTDVRGEGSQLAPATNDLWSHSPVKEAKGASFAAGNHFDDDAISPPTVIAHPPTPAKGADRVRAGAEGREGVRDLRGNEDEVLEALMNEFESLRVLTEAAVERWDTGMT